MFTQNKNCRICKVLTAKTIDQVTSNAGKTLASHTWYFMQQNNKFPHITGVEVTLALLCNPAAQYLSIQCKLPVLFRANRNACSTIYFPVPQKYLQKTTKLIPDQMPETPFLVQYLHWLHEKTQPFNIT